MVNTAISQYGRLDFAHNNAGIVGAGAPIVELPEAVWERGTGVFLCMRQRTKNTEFWSVIMRASDQNSVQMASAGRQAAPSPVGCQ